MENNTSRILTIEEVMQDKSLSGLLEAARFLEKNKDKIIFPKKYMMSLKHWVEEKVYRIYLNTPDMPLLKVVIVGLDGLYEKLPPEMILEITDFIMKEWQSLVVPNQEKVSELQLA